MDIDDALLEYVVLESIKTQSKGEEKMEELAKLDLIQFATVNHSNLDQCTLRRMHKFKGN